MLLVRKQRMKKRPRMMRPKNLVKIAAIRLLARREHSRRDLSQKLALRGFEHSDINAVLDALEQDDLLSEPRFIGSIVRTRSQRGVGPLKIIAELQRHGITQKEIEQDEDWQIIDWVQVAQQAKIKRFGEDTPQNMQEQSKQYRFLIQRGFLPEHIVFA